MARLRALVKSAGSAGPPPGPARPEFWRSPLRGPWLTAVFGLALLFGITVLFVTGLLPQTYLRSIDVTRYGSARG